MEPATNRHVPNKVAQMHSLEHHNIGVLYLFILLVCEHQEWHCSKGLMSEHFAWEGRRGWGWGRGGVSTQAIEALDSSLPYLGQILTAPSVQGQRSPQCTPGRGTRHSTAARGRGGEGEWLVEYPHVGSRLL